jgi:hypothetical protein
MSFIGAHVRGDQKARPAFGLHHHSTPGDWANTLKRLGIVHIGRFPRPPRLTHEDDDLSSGMVFFRMWPEKFLDELAVFGAQRRPER